jgi:hypothetical protein
VPGSKVPSAPFGFPSWSTVPQKSPLLCSIHVVVTTGIDAIALAVPLVHVSGTPSPTVTSTRTELSSLDGPHGPTCGILQTLEWSLVSPTSFTV